MGESCISCGRDTRVGTPLFSARKRGRDTVSGDEGYLCQACQEGSAAPGAEQSVPLSGRYAVIEIRSMGPG